jgi:hypothetical protein
MRFPVTSEPSQAARLRVAQIATAGPSRLLK